MVYRSRAQKKPAGVGLSGLLPVHWTGSSQVDPIQPQGNDKPEKNGSPFHKAGRSFAFYRRYENAARPEGSGVYQVWRPNP